jgi:hypothetical protein
MKNAKNRTETVLRDIRAKAFRIQAAATTALTFGAAPGTVWAGDAKLKGMLGDDANGSMATQVNAGFSIMKTLIDVATWLFVFMGAFYLLPGLFKLINSLRNNQPEETSGAAKDVAVGIVLCMFKVLWSGVESVLF